MQTNDPDIYAIGDVAELLIGLQVNLKEFNLLGMHIDKRYIVASHLSWKSSENQWISWYDNYEIIFINRGNDRPFGEKSD